MSVLLVLLSAACSGLHSDSAEADELLDMVVSEPLPVVGATVSCEEVFTSRDLGPDSASIVIEGFSSPTSFADVGDIDEDGFNELIVTDIGIDEAYLMSGAALLVGAGSTINISDALWVLAEEGGFDASSAGDVDGDGLQELILGIPYLDHGGSYSLGGVYLFRGGSGALTGEPDAVVLGEASGDRTGRSVSGGEDVDGDGLDDILMGSSGRLSDVAHILLGDSGLSGEIALADSDFLLQVTAGDIGGNEVAMLEDADGDGYADLLVNVYGESGDWSGAYLIYGSELVEATSLMADVGTLYWSEEDRGGFAIASAGDTDGDGLTDVLISAIDDDEAGSQVGAVYVLPGSNEASAGDSVMLKDVGTKILGEASEYTPLTGTALGGGGDINGDGFTDLLIGASSWGESREGAMYLLRGPAASKISLSDADLRLTGASSSEGVGDELGFLSDLDGDGQSEIAVSSSGGDEVLVFLSGDLCLQPLRDADRDGSLYGKDCDDTDHTLHPDAVEVCDTIDNDCDGYIDALDDDVSWDIWYLDADGDGYGGIDEAKGCRPPREHVAAGGDCDDTDADIGPAALEIWYDGIDQDCDGGSDYDADGDGIDRAGYGSGLGLEDCDDTDAGVSPLGVEHCDGVDTDCDGVVDEVCLRLAEADAFWGGGNTGVSVDGAGDVNGDGQLDLIIGSAEYGWPTRWGAAWLVTDGDVSDAEVLFTGVVDNDRVGANVAGVGDVDADGYDDVLLSSAHAGVGGTAWLMAGGAGVADGDVGGAVATLLGAVGDDAGHAIDGGDINGDGYADLLITANSAGDGETRIFHGPVAGALWPADADAVLTADSFRIKYRDEAWVSGAGDVNGDGYEDVLVSAPRSEYLYESIHGLAFMNFGPLSGELGLYGDSDVMFVNNDYRNLLSEVAGAGDLDADGYDDILIAGSTYVCVFYGPIPDSFHRLPGECGDSITANGNTALVVDGAGDVDGDGIGDLIIGDEANGFDGPKTGAGWLVYGPIEGRLTLRRQLYLPGEARGDRAGAAVSGVGDIDSDGLDDILIGAPGAGRAYLLFGADL